jgi:sugar phosphate isomerase/epimerase
MNLGISSYTYTWSVGVPGFPPDEPLTPFTLIDKAVETEVSLVQIADNMPLEKLPAEDILKIREYAARRSVSIEMGGRGLTPEHTLSCLETARLIGSPILRMVIDGAGFEPDIHEISSIIKDLLPEFRSRNIALAIENHDRFRARDFERIVNNAADGLIGICLDSVNSMGAGEGFEEVARTLLPYTINLHIKDFTIKRVSHKMGLVIEGAPAGRGMLNIAELISSAAASGRCNSAILELWTPPDHELAATLAREKLWAGESIDYLKHLIR